MRHFETILAISLRRFFRLALGRQEKFGATYENCDFFGQEACDLIREGLESSKPFAASRFGYSELRALLTFLHIKEKKTKVQKILSFAVGEKVEPWWADNTVRIITHNAGIFPCDLNIIDRFCRLTLDDLKEIDVLGSWLGGEKEIRHLMTTTKFIRFSDFYHFFHSVPWTNALAGKRVLVIHPFADSIQHQFKKKDLIFNAPHKLPDFELITLKAIQSIAGNQPSGLKDWFHALDKMKSDIGGIDFDIAILGCGAYGMPLAAFVKRDLGKKALHLGGNTQILFGVKGSRWENDPKFFHIFNEHWIKPFPNETPAGHLTIDNNCYW